MFSARRVVPCREVVDLGGGECANRSAAQGRRWQLGMVEPRRAHRPAAFARPPNRPPSRGRRGRPLIAALLSCLLPGAGQLYLGHRRRGVAMLVVTALWWSSRSRWRASRRPCPACWCNRGPCWPCSWPTPACWCSGGGGAGRLPAGPAGQLPGAGAEQRLAQGAAAGLVVVVLPTAAPTRPPATTTSRPMTC